MTYDSTLISYFLHASIVVKCVMFILIGASILSWSYIFQRFFYLKKAARQMNQFEKIFRSGEALNQLYLNVQQQLTDLSSIQAVFSAGYQEFKALQKAGVKNIPLMVENIKRATRVAQMREQDQLESRLHFLAIVGSTSPYIGLFGTVWGIMQAFRALANVSQATIAMVAPGIAEALIATALGLFAAIPAVIAYNRFVTDLTRLINRLDAFQEELINRFTRITIEASSKNDSDTTQLPFTSTSNNPDHLIHQTMIQE